MNSDQFRKLIDVVSESSQGVAEGSEEQGAHVKYFQGYNDAKNSKPSIHKTLTGNDRYNYVMGYKDGLTDRKKPKEQGVAEGSLEEYGDTKQGQKMLDKVHHRAANRVTSKQADKDPAYARRAQQTQDRAWDRMKDKDVAEAEKKPHPKTWHDVDKKLGRAVDKMSQAEKVKKGLAHPDTLKKQGVAEGLTDTQQKITDTINKLEDRLKHAKTPEQWDNIKNRIERLQAGLKRSKQGVAEGKKTLRDYIAESELAYSRPVQGDNFAINIREEVLLETYVVDSTDDAIVIHADDRMMQVLEAFGYLSEGFDTDMDQGESEDDAAMSDIEQQDAGEYDYEGDMAKDDLETIVRAARKLTGMLDDNENMPEWVQSKINKAADYVDTAADYIESNQDDEIAEAKYQGREVPLGKPMKGDVAKSKVYVRDPKTGNVKKVNFGDPNMKIKKSNPARRKSFRARHNCDNPGPRTKARYWSCRAW